MRHPDDDELYEVDQTYLGPPGRYIAPMRHKAIFAWLVIAPTLAVIVRRLDLPVTLLTGGLLLMFTLWLAMFIADHVGSETPAAALFTTFRNELTTPRPHVRGEQAGGVRLSRVMKPRGGLGRCLDRRTQVVESGDGP